MSHSATPGPYGGRHDTENPYAGLPRADPTPEELAERKRISDRAELLDHIDHILRPPPSVYDEIEDAIRHALAGDLTARIKSRDGQSYVVADLMDRWELEEMLEVYRRQPEDPSYE